MPTSLDPSSLYWQAMAMVKAAEMKFKHPHFATHLEEAAAARGRVKHNQNLADRASAISQLYTAAIVVIGLANESDDAQESYRLAVTATGLLLNILYIASQIGSFGHLPDDLDIEKMSQSYISGAKAVAETGALGV